MKHPLRTLLLAVCCGLAAACTQRQERLKLMSYNIRNGIGIDNIQDIGRIARASCAKRPTWWRCRNWTAPRYVWTGVTSPVNWGG